MKPHIALGLMSGTSLDGIDACFIETDGETIFEIGPSITAAYPEQFRSRLAAEVEKAGAIGQPTSNEALISKITELHFKAVSTLLEQPSLKRKWQRPDVIGFHGHTVLHRPQSGFTQQIGNAQLLADQLKITVVSDFRQNDVDAGGEGAPLAPVYHAAMFSDEVRPTLVLNIGGISNVTWIGNDTNGLVAFDTGPGNCLLDMWIEQKIGALFDKDGEIAARGDVDEGILAAALSHPFFSRPWPKSLDRTDFDLSLFKNLSCEDGASTLVEFTVRSVLKGVHECPETPKSIFVTGGGRRNLEIMKRLKEQSPCAVYSIDERNWDGDAVEAQAFAFMAVRSLKRLPISFPGTTGVNSAMTGGVISSPRQN